MAAYFVHVPRRPQSHVIADRATAAVSRLIIDAGFAVEVVKNDYGEDPLPHWITFSGRPA
jgi:hypothetical protein